MPVNPQTYTYKSADDCSIKADVYRPLDDGTRRPTIIYVHGGCLIYGSRTMINPEQLALYTEAGYTVVSIDYRLAPETKLPEIISDLQDAVYWVTNSGPGMFSVDPGRIAVVGHSAGGYLALMAGWCVAPRPKAVVSFYGYGDIVGDWYSKPDPFYCQLKAVAEEESGRHIEGPIISEPYESRQKDSFYVFCRQNGLWPLEVGGHDPEREPSFFVQYCPLQNITADYSPTLLLHGNRDTDVPYEQSVLMAEEMSRNNVEHELITLNDRGHGFDGEMDDPEVKDAFDRVLSFLDLHVKTKRA